MQEITDNAGVEFKVIIEKRTQIYCANIEFTILEEYYCCTVFILLMNSLIQQPNERFRGETKSAMKGMYRDVSQKKLPISEIFGYYQSNHPSESILSQEIQVAEMKLG